LSLYSLPFRDGEVIIVSASIKLGRQKYETRNLLPRSYGLPVRGITGTSQRDVGYDPDRRKVMQSKEKIRIEKKRRRWRRMLCWL
jgi:hypothetical protein